MVRRLARAAAALVLVAAAPALPAQSRFVIRAPWKAWRTVETAHWTVHYPADAAAFAACLVPRLEPMYRAASAVVGFAPAPRVTLVIEDAMSFDGAYASANARAPVIVLQTQPSTPRSGGYSDCASARMVHELTHILQLSRPWGPAHAAWRRALIRLLPAEPGPILFRRKPWLRESYAEYVEGRLTPTGAPYTTARADVVRQLALADGLPAYARLNDSYEGQYLVGAAFAEWLAARAGAPAFDRLWRLMASPTWPGEAEAFRSLFGAAPESLYARFAGEAAARAREARDRLAAARGGLVRGERVRGVGWADGIAVSPDGARVAAVIGTPVLRLTLWPAGDTAAAPLRLPIPTGQSPSAPRFTRDGARVLVVNWELVGGGVWRPDLYEWELATRRMRRVTRGAAIRDADPMPNGREAVGARCAFGVCDLVIVDLATGSVRVLASGTPSRAYYRPRVSPNGRAVAATVQSGASAHVVLVDVGSGAVRSLDPGDGAWRYEPAFLPDGRLVVVSDASGIPNLEIVDPVTGSARALTRLLSPAVAPEPDPTGRAVYFVRRTTAGSELRRVALAEAAETTVVLRDSTLAPAVPVPLPTPAPALFTPEPTSAARPYGLGPRFVSVLPAFAWSADGASGGGLLWSSDIVGRLSVMANGTLGQGSAWRGVSLTAAWRGHRLPLFVDAAAAAQPASADADSTFHGLRYGVQYRGVSARTELERGPWARRQRLRLGASAGSVRGWDESGDGASTRALASLVYRADVTQVSDWFSSEAVTLGGTVGRSAGVAWARWNAAATVEIGRTNVASLFTLSGTYAAVTRDAPAFERLAVGGAAPLVDDLALGQRIAQPMLPTGALAGSRAATARVSGPRLGPVTPFLWGASAGERLTRWRTLAGVGRTFRDDPRRNWRVPGAQLSGGVGYELGAARGWRAFASLTFEQE